MTVSGMGITVFVLFLILLFFIGLFFIRKQFSSTLLSILILTLVLRIFAAQDPFLHQWDERYHALVAKNMVDQPLKPTLHQHVILPSDNENWVGANIWLAKPSFPLWILSGSIACFGANLWALRLPSILLGLLAVYLTFLIGKRIFKAEVGLVAAFLFAINGLLVELGAGRVSSDHVELCFIICVQIAIYFALYVQREKSTVFYPLLVGCFMGFAFLSKWYPALIVLPVWTGLFLGARGWNFKIYVRHLLWVLIGFSLSALPWLAYMWSTFPLELKMILTNAATAYDATVENHSAAWYYYLHKIMVVFGELIYIPLAMASYLLIKAFNKNRRFYLGLMIWILIPLCVFSMADTKRFTYVLIAAPAFFILVGNVVVHCIEAYRNHRFKFVFLGVACLMILLPIRYTIERVKFFDLPTTSTTFYAKPASYYEELDQSSIVFGTPDYVEMMFHTNVYAAYRRIPEQKLIDSLMQQDFKIYFWENDALTLLNH